MFTLVVVMWLQRFPESQIALCGTFALSFQPFKTLSFTTQATFTHSDSGGKVLLGYYEH